MLRRALALTLLTALATGVAASPAAAAGPVGPEGTEPVVVRFRPGTPEGERTRALAGLGLAAEDDGDAGDFSLARPDGSGRFARTARDGVAAAALPPTSAVVEVAPEIPVEAHAAPNDPHWVQQWNLRAVQAERAWEVTTGSGAVVAVLDTGVAAGAPDLAGTRFVAGRDLVDGDDRPDDRNGHGTHVTGTIAQTTNNGVGAAGLAHGASIMPVRVLDDAGAGTDHRTAQGIRWAVDNGAHVINMSLGGASRSQVLADAVRYAHDRGVVLVASTGNDGSDAVSFPAAYDEVIAVGAVRLDRTRAPYSNRGTQVELVAPGGDLSRDQDADGVPDGIVQQTLRSRGSSDFCMCVYEGTSMAAPHVSAVAAMLVARGTRGPAAVRAALRAGAADLGAPGRDQTFGFGLVQARSALDAATPSPATTSLRTIDLACPTSALSLVRGRFGDVPASDVHGRAVDCMAWWGVTAGATATTFRPAGTVTREQMASFIARTIEEAGHRLPAAPPDAFDDDGASAHKHRIDQLAAVGVVQGTGNRRYSPTAPVTRAALATFVVRAHERVAGRPLTATRDHFDDDRGSAHEANINLAAEAGLTGGTGQRVYSPARNLSRAQMTSFLARTLDSLIGAGHAEARR